MSVARLALCVVGALLDRDRDGLFVFFVGVVLLGATAPLNPTTKRLVSAPLPVCSLAGLIAISGLAPTSAAAATMIVKAKKDINLVQRGGYTARFFSVVKIDIFVSPPLGYIFRRVGRSLNLAR